MITIPGVKMINPADDHKPDESWLIYGHHDTGKSHLLADAMVYYQGLGLNTIILVLAGEDPMTTYSQFGLGSSVVKVKTLAEYDKVIKAVAGKVDVIGMDSVTPLQRTVMDSLFGINQFPGSQEGSDPKRDWPKAHAKLNQMLNMWKDAAPISIAVAPADRSADSFIDPESKKSNLVCVNLDGKAAYAIQGAIPRIGYLEANLVTKIDPKTKVSTTSIHRLLHFEKRPGFLSRANGAKKPITEPLELDESSGGWQKVVELFNGKEENDRSES